MAVHLDSIEMKGILNHWQIKLDWFSRREIKHFAHQTSRSSSGY
jgi:hypothetical protein